MEGPSADEEPRRTPRRGRARRRPIRPGPEGSRGRLPLEESPEFLRLLRGEPRPDLVRVTLEIARDAHPDLDLELYLGKIEALADRVRDRCAAGAKPRSILGQINWVLYVEEGYRGNTADYY